MWDFAKGRIWLFAGAALLAAAATGAAELPPEVAVDRLLVRAERQAQEGGHQAALATLNEALALVEEQGMAVPGAFWFQHAQAASVAGEHAKAVESATRYVMAAGRDGKHYRAALGVLDRSQREVRELRERKAAERSERERAQAAERAERMLRAEAAAVASYWDLRDSAAASPAGIGKVFAEAVQSGGLGPAMVVIPAGTFRMGCLSGDGDCLEREKPIREVTIAQPFALSVHEVTFAEWDACVAAGDCRGHKPDDEGWGRGTRPVINVSWDDAQAYVWWLSGQTGAAYRLPSEAEWEYAARAGTVTKYHWGDGVGSNRANCITCGSPWDGVRTAPVGSFAPNAFGLRDAHGNVWEWVADCGNPSYRGAPSDGGAWLGGDCTERVLRGGSWLYGPTDLHAANRLNLSSGISTFLAGFRVARTLTP